MLPDNIQRDGGLAADKYPMFEDGRGNVGETRGRQRERPGRRRRRNRQKYVDGADGRRVKSGCN